MASIDLKISPRAENCFRFGDDDLWLDVIAADGELVIIFPPNLDVWMTENGVHFKPKGQVEREVDELKKR